MVFIGLKAVRITNPSQGDIGKVGLAWKNVGIKHFNPHFIKIVDEKEMRIIMDDNSVYRIDEEGLQIFLAAMYGDEDALG